MKKFETTTNLNSEDFQTLEDLLYVKNNLRNLYGKVIVKELNDIVSNNSLLTVISSLPNENEELASVSYHVKLTVNDLRDYYNIKEGSTRVKNREACRNLKREYITETVIDPFTNWLHLLIAQNNDIEFMISELKEKYGATIKNFVIPSLFSLTVGVDTDVVYISYKLI